MCINISRALSPLWSIAVLALASISAVAAYAHDATPVSRFSTTRKEPIVILTKIIQADFDATDNGGQRIDNVAFTRARAQTSYGPKPGYYMLDWDEFEVATTWQFREERELSETLVEVSVEFRIVGRAKGGKTKDKGITPVPNSQARVITYKVVKTSDGWKVTDPPIPIVGLDPLKRFYQAKLERLSSQITSMEDKGLRPYPNLVKARELAARRLKDIEALRKLM